MEPRTIRSTNTSGRTDSGQGLWPVLLLLSIAVLIPTACVLWFMSQAVANERFAVRQRLADVYRGQLETVRTQLGEHWRSRVAALSRSASRSPAAAFQQAVLEGGWAGVVVRDNAGKVLYPGPADTASSQPAGSNELIEEQWQAAHALEFEHDEYEAAAAAYAELAAGVDQPEVAARALQGQVRCLLQTGHIAAALKIVSGRLLEPACRDALDEDGRSISVNAAMLVLQLVPNPSRAEYVRARDYLLEALNDYTHSRLPSSQRVFVMQQMTQTLADEHLFPALPAEQLAAQYLAGRSPLPAPGGMGPASVPGVWSWLALDGTTIGLVRESEVQAQAANLLKRITAPADAAVQLMPAEQVLQRREEPFVTMPVGEMMPDWQLTLTLTGPNPFTAAAERRVSVYLWIGVLVIISTGGVALLVGRYLGRQMRLTRLKNDLIATVSHELKTPLASIRALVDTLITRDGQDPQQTREYLNLIARENARLSRLIDNFLTFSRMERNRHAFEFARCSPACIAEAACHSLQERLESAGCDFHVNIGSDLPDVTADFDAMVTVVLNLLDNALKYTGDNKRIELRVCADADQVCFEVEDNGIGLSKRAARRVFDRFYQVDQSLSRRAGGCGLGLSIVHFIVRAHGGTIDVQSQPGQGSTFTVRVPAESVPARTALSPEVPA